MTLQTPRWWYQRKAEGGWRYGRPQGQFVRLLAWPLSKLWAFVTARRIAKTTPVSLEVSVISVGNLTVGGSGKTPVAREILRLLTHEGKRAVGLSRGHGGRLKGPVRVDPQSHTAADVGDEPLMLAKDYPIYIARDRVAGGQLAVVDGAEVIVLDDAHQNPALAKSSSLVVVDGETRQGQWPFGDGQVFPAGPMREPLEAGLARADAVVVLLPVGLEAPNPDLLSLFDDKPVLIARLIPTADVPAGPLVGFAGIAKPWKAEESLKAAGADLKDFASFPDHAAYSEDDLATLAALAERHAAQLITTEKDWVRLPKDWQGRILTWPVIARFDDPAKLTERLLRWP